MHRGAALLLGLLALATAVGSAPVAAEPTPNGTVFPVVGADRNASDPATANRYRAVAGDPDSDAALIPASGSQDALLYSGHTFQAYGFGTQNVYLDAAWLPDGGAYLAGIDPRERVSRLWSFGPDGVRPMLSTNVTIQAVDVGPAGRALAVGGTATNGSGFALTLDENGSVRDVPVPAGTPLRDVAWHPSGDGALIAGLEGALYRYRNGSLRRIDGVGDAFLTAVAWRADGGGIVAVGAADTNGSSPSGGGVMFAGTVDGVDPVARFPGPLRDVSWRPGGRTGLAVGGGPSSPAVHAVGADGSVRTHEIDASAIAVDWYTRNDAVLVGGDRIWRYALDTEPADLPTTASLTVTPRAPEPAEPFAIQGYGSTFRGSADAVAAWQFAVGGNVTAWRPSSSLRAQFRRAGRYTVGVRVRAANGSTSRWRNATLTVGNPSPPVGDAERPADDTGTPIALLMALTGAVLVVVLAASWLRRR